jgi:hypothetical protein
MAQVTTPWSSSHGGAFSVDPAETITEPWSGTWCRFVLAVRSPPQVSTVHDDTPSFRDQAGQTRQEILDWAASRGQLMLVALAALVVVAFILAFAGV